MAWKRGESGNPTGAGGERGGRPRGTGAKRSALLSAMLRVMKRPVTDDRTELEKKCRKLFDEDFGKFVDRLTRLRSLEEGKAEQQVAQGVNGDALSAGPLGFDANEVKILALIDELRGGPKLEIATKVREGVKAALEALALQFYAADPADSPALYTRLDVARFISESLEKLPAVAVS